MDDETTRKRLPDRVDTESEVFCRFLDIDIEADCITEKKCCSLEYSIAVLRHDDAPEFLRGNPYIVHGYRTTLPFTLCIWSLFTWSNDSVNIWTHLIGFLIFFYLMVRDIVVSFPMTTAKKCTGSLDNDHWTAMSPVLSTSFNWLSPVPVSFCKGVRALAFPRPQWNSDWFAGLLPAGHTFRFYCLSVWRDVYLLVICFLFLTVLYYQTKPRHMSLSWFHYRVLLYISLTAYGVIPAMHWVYVNGGWKSEIVQLFASKILVVYLLAIAAFAFYITQFPERCFPGKCDYVGSSHQVWHVIVVILFYWWYQAGKELIDYRANHPLPGLTIDASIDHGHQG